MRRRKFIVRTNWIKNHLVVNKIEDNSCYNKIILIQCNKYDYLSEQTPESIEFKHYRYSQNCIRCIMWQKCDWLGISKKYNLNIYMSGIIPPIITVQIGWINIELKKISILTQTDILGNVKIYFLKVILQLHVINF